MSQEPALWRTSKAVYASGHPTGGRRRCGHSAYLSILGAPYLSHGLQTLAGPDLSECSAEHTPPLLGSESRGAHSRSLGPRETVLRRQCRGSWQWTRLSLAQDASELSQSDRLGGGQGKGDGFLIERLLLLIPGTVSIAL